MTSRLHQRVREALAGQGITGAGTRLGVAVSGGSDSVALFLLLQDSCADLGVLLSIVHFNHQLRGVESNADEGFVRDLAKRAGVEFHLRCADVAAEARRNGWNVEDAGRRLRLQFFQQLVDQGRVDRVATAHTADDQAETVLAHLLRGSGLGGLAGIHPVAGPVVRPLLSIHRKELRAFLSARNQPWREDASNQDTARLRARIRHELLPLLERDYQPALVERLCRLADLAGGEEEFWNALTEERLERIAERSPSEISVPVAELASVSTETGARLHAGSLAMARRLVRRAVREVSGSPPCAAAHVERVLELARQGQGGQRVELPGGVRVERTLDRRLRFFVEETKREATSYQFDVGWPLANEATLQVREAGCRFSLKLIDWPPAPSETRTGRISLDAALLTPPLVLRNWRPGDAYRPAGRHRVHKLKELLYQVKVEAAARASWPILTSSGQVIWARGLPPASDVAVHAGTRKGLWISEERIES